MTKSLVVGLDGGGTKTTCVVIDGNKRLLGTATTGSTNRNSVGDIRAREHMAQALRNALDAAACRAADVTAICLGMSGLGRPEDRRLVEQWLHEILPNVPAIIHNDAVIALASGTQGRLYGVVVISGTGMIVYGVDQHGRAQRAGGWGALLGDPGGGYAIGSAILQAITAAVDGYGPPTALQDAVLAVLDLAQPSDLIRWAYTDLSWERFAQLAPLASQWAQRGDDVASTILEQAASALATATNAVIDRLHLEDTNFPLVVAGGNLTRGPLAEMVGHKVQRLAVDADLVYPPVPPAMGAALLALNTIRETQRRSS